MKKLFMGILILLSQISFAEEEAKELPPLDPAYMGVHGMALFTQGSSIYASHMPLYHKPHDVQLLYKLDNNNLALLQTIRDGDLITIKPQPFNLQRLMRGEKMVLNVDLYSGHFERDGMLVYENIPMTFDKKLYVRSLDSSPVPKRSELQYKFLNCGTMKPLYFETKDFVKH